MPKVFRTGVGLETTTNRMVYDQLFVGSTYKVILKTKSDYLKITIFLFNIDKGWGILGKKPPDYSNYFFLLYSQFSLVWEWHKLSRYLSIRKSSHSIDTVHTHIHTHSSNLHTYHLRNKWITPNIFCFVCYFWQPFLDFTWTKGNTS